MRACVCRFNLPVRLGVTHTHTLACSAGLIETHRICPSNKCAHSIARTHSCMMAQITIKQRKCELARARACVCKTQRHITPPICLLAHAYYTHYTCYSAQRACFSTTTRRHGRVAVHSVGRQRRRCRRCIFAYKTRGTASAMQLTRIMYQHVRVRVCVCVFDSR